MAIRLEMWGDYALFTRPEMKTERVSYDVMTPSAARGIIEAIYWHPGIRWNIRKIYVCSPIEFVNLRRNEVASVVNSQTAKTVMERGSGELFLSTTAAIQQRAALLLKNVHYVIEADFSITENATPNDNAGKFQDIIKRRALKGQFYHQPYFGCREFPVNFALCQCIPECPPALKGEKDLGYMLYDMDYTDPQNITPRFFRAVMRDGVITVPQWDSPEVIG